jgi:bifunctional DNA primase/polymerase-like protein
VNPLTEAAIQYLGLGLKVIALTGKTPNVKLHKTGLHSHLAGKPETDEDVAFIASFFEHADTTGVGILTSFPYVVVDIDGEEGAQQWAELNDMSFEGSFVLPDVRWVAMTGRGLHLWYATTVPTGTIKLGAKLDLKGDGGYVAAPPSLHPDGHTYKWLRAPSAEAPPMEVPEPLARRIEDHLFDIQMAKDSKTLSAAKWGPKYNEGDTVFYAQASHDALIDGMLTAEEGNRNAYLHWAAATLDEENGSSEEFEQLAENALAAGLEPVEIRRTIKSGRHSGRT